MPWVATHLVVPAKKRQSPSSLLCIYKTGVNRMLNIWTLFFFNAPGGEAPTGYMLKQEM